jgi:CheY-like chemotaxis protein
MAEAIPPVVAVVADLFFTVKIHEAAKRAGTPIVFVKSETDALDKARAGAALVLVDLNYAAIDGVRLGRELKALGVRAVGYLSHVQVDLKKQAQEAGYDMVVARSVLSQNLPQILGARQDRS